MLNKYPYFCKYREKLCNIKLEKFLKIAINKKKHAFCREKKSGEVQVPRKPQNFLQLCQRAHFYVYLIFVEPRIYHLYCLKHGVLTLSPTQSGESLTYSNTKLHSEALH